jgi:hypothetical protein
MAAAQKECSGGVLAQSIVGADIGHSQPYVRYVLKH